MEEFWRDYYALDCTYRYTCLYPSDSARISECVSVSVESKLYYCDPSQFHPCTSYGCIEAWQELKDAATRDDGSISCEVDWSSPYEQCDASAVMFQACLPEGGD